MDYTGKDTLEFLKDAVNYNRFLETSLARFIAPSPTAIDFGAGNGEFAVRIKARNITVTAVEPDPILRNILDERGIANVDDIGAAPTAQRIYSMNVLEHIEDDGAALRALHAKLEPGGKIFIYVPAFMCLYTEFDKAIGHYRRYTRKELSEKLQRAGFEIESAQYVDALGFLCWFVMGKIPGNKTRIHPLMIRLFDRVIFPLSRVADVVTKNIFGKNLAVVARRP